MSDYRRPAWCPHAETCTPIAAPIREEPPSSGGGCGGRMATPELHGSSVVNTHRFCLRGAADDGEWMLPLKVHSGDCWRLEILLRAIRADAQKAKQAERRAQ